MEKKMMNEKELNQVNGGKNRHIENDTEYDKHYKSYDGTVVHKGDKIKIVANAQGRGVSRLGEEYTVDKRKGDGAGNHYLVLDINWAVVLWIISADVSKIS